MRRRELMKFAGSALIAWPAMARAQQATKVPRLGFLGFGNAAASANRVEALRAGLRDLGYIEGKNLVVVFRWMETVEHLQEAAAELVGMNVDVIFATSSTEVEPARRATKTIPIVFATHADPIGLGHIASLSRPGGNITGLANLSSEITEKQLEILKEAVPHATRFGVFWSSTVPSHRPILQAAEAVSGRLGVRLLATRAETIEDFQRVFASAAREHADAIFFAGSSLIRAQRTPLAELALKHRLPSMFQYRENVEAGGLMSYGADQADLTRRAATFDKILKGAHPTDLPVEQASKYQLVINLKTANALGLTIPSSILARADEVIE
jgi:putative ABC transport system substrate-binding protein